MGFDKLHVYTVFTPSPMHLFAGMTSRMVSSLSVLNVYIFQIFVIKEVFVLVEPSGWTSEMHSLSLQC